jgi:hypothetical protein
MEKLTPAPLTGKREAAPNALLDAALTYTGKGWRVFPCHSAPGCKCSCGNYPCGTYNKHAGKHPRTQHGCQDTTTNEQRIRSWAVKWPGCNWAVATGPDSGVFVLDVDGKEGRASLAELEAQHGTLPATLTSRTGREDGGEHRWFAWPVDRDIRNGQNKLGNGLDLRGVGGYVIVPPSAHRTGRAYEWLAPDAPIADAPEWLLERATAALPAAGRNADSSIPKLQRTKTLFRIGCALRGRGGTLQAIVDELLGENSTRCVEPLPEEKVRSMAADLCSRYPPGPSRTDASQPLREFLLSACHKNNLEFIGLGKHAKWRSPMFIFARLVKGRQEFAGMDALHAAERIEQEIDSPWALFSDVCDDQRAQLIADWEAAHTVASDDDTLTRAWAEAQRFPVEPPVAYSEKFCMCMSLFAALQRVVGADIPIIGPQERIAALLGVVYSMVGKYIQWGIRDGLLTRTAVCVPRQKAAEYVFDLSRVKMKDTIL